MTIIILINGTILINLMFPVILISWCLSQSRSRLTVGGGLVKQIECYKGAGLIGGLGGPVRYR
jgi:hypothetical protein